jgi:CHAT domain-containing protein/Tfp pilus assembly protein PilF
MRQLLSLLFFFVFSCYTYAQVSYTLADTAKARYLIEEAAKLSNQKLFDNAFFKTDTAQLIYEKVLGNESKEVANMFDSKALIFMNKNRIDSAIYLHEKGLEIRKKLFGDVHIDIATSYDYIGNCYRANRKYDKAIEYLEKSLTIKIKTLDSLDEKISLSYAIIGIVYNYLGDFNKAISYEKKTLDLWIKKLGPNHINISEILIHLGNSYFDIGKSNEAFSCYKDALNIQLKSSETNFMDLARTYESLGEYHSHVGEYDKAIENDEKAYEIFFKNFGINNKNTASSLSNLANSYALKGEYNKALDFHQRAYDIRVKILPPVNQFIAISLNNLGNAYDIREEYDKAIDYKLKSLDIRLKLQSPNLPKIAYAYNSLGFSYLEKGDFENAISNFTKALDIRLKTLDSLHNDIAITYLGIGNAYTLKNQLDTAYKYYQKALQIREKIFGVNHPSSADLYDCFAKYYELKNDTIKAIESAQKAFNIYQKKDKKVSMLVKIANIKLKEHRFYQVDSLLQNALAILNYKNEKDLDNILSINELINVLSAKANFERIRYDNTKDLTCLSQSIQTYNQTISAINYQKKSFKTEGAKATSAYNNSSIYEFAIMTILSYDSINKSNSIKNQISNYFEQSKAGILQSQLIESDALKYSGIPNVLLKKEYDLRVNITWREKQKQEKRNAGKSETDSTVLAISSKLFDLKQEYETLKQNLEKNYPDYYRLKYDLKTVSVDDIQKKMLSPQQTLLSYFVGDSSIFAFVVKLDTFAVFTIKKDFPLEMYIKQLRDGLYGYQTAAVKTEKLYEAKADSFAQAAYQLHEKLIRPLSILLTKEVILVPDGVLGYVPFDALLSEKPKAATKFNTHHYLGKNHIISYNYSATLWHSMQNKKHKTEPTKNFVGFAPYYNGDTTVLSKLFGDDLSMRKGLDSLKYSGEEVFKAQKLMGGESVLAQKATKKTFEETASNYRIIHLATHGKANDKAGDYCFLAFTEQKDSIDNELLYVRDIYNLSLNADLVVLSACETGIGELKRGEGIVSLARAFAYSGAKSMVTSLWSVNDKSTMQIMENFYRNLRKGQTKNYALWKAKQDYWLKAKGEFAHPFYWSSFIPIGDMKPVKILP